jgi:hypothetical protein
MRLQLPTRVSIPMTVLFAGALVVMQQFEHTNISFSLLFFAYTIISAVTFNAAGGLDRPSGAYVLFFALFTVVAAVTLKAFVGEPADSNLEDPLLTMSVYTVGSVLMLAAVMIARRLTGPVRGLGNLLGWRQVNLTFSALGCTLVGILIFTLDLLPIGLPDGLLSALNQLNVFLPLGLILATVDAVQRSDGRRSFNAVSTFGFLAAFLIGVTSFSKQGMFTPFLAWAIGATYGRLKVRAIHAVGALVCLLLMWSVLAPISQVGRTLADDTTLIRRLEIAVQLGATLQQTLAAEDEAYQAGIDQETHHGYFDRNVGLGDRLAMFQFDDGLISWTSQNEPVGYAPVWFYLENLIPRLFLKSKGVGETAYNGNFYAHRVGGYLASSDVTTGISFGFLGEAFAIAGWQGVLLLSPIIWIFLFVVTDTVAGSLRSGPWALLPMLYFAHLAPESLLGGVIWYTWYGNIGLCLAIAFCVYVAPLLGSVLGAPLARTFESGQQRRAAIRTAAAGRA